MFLEALNITKLDRIAKNDIWIMLIYHLVLMDP